MRIWHGIVLVALSALIFRYAHEVAALGVFVSAFWIFFLVASTSLVSLIFPERPFDRPRSTSLGNFLEGVGGCLLVFLCVVGSLILAFLAAVGLLFAARFLRHLL
ncbi:MAG TPA: hypothetical protein VFT74_06235 [Isosphaeraceae bacterium]|nr:hypothetical protein [Isosphaeraceae bacterium]